MSPKTVYIIVPSLAAANNYEMLNASVSPSFDAVRKNDVESKYLFEVQLPAAEVFSSYQWYSRSEILDIMEESEWL